MTQNKLIELTAEYATLKALKGGWTYDEIQYAERRMEHIENIISPEQLTSIQQGIENAFDE